MEGASEYYKSVVRFDQKCVRYVAAKSPVLSHVSSTVDGIPTIRALKSEKWLAAEFDHHQVCIKYLKFYDNC